MDVRAQGAKRDQNAWSEIHKGSIQGKIKYNLSIPADSKEKMSIRPIVPMVPMYQWHCVLYCLSFN